MAFTKRNVKTGAEKKILQQTTHPTLCVVIRSTSPRLQPGQAISQSSEKNDLFLGLCRWRRLGVFHHGGAAACAGVRVGRAGGRTTVGQRRVAPRRAPSILHRRLAEFKG